MSSETSSNGTDCNNLSFVEFVNEKLWLLTEQPEGWRESLDELESRYFGTDTGQK